jgi:purine-nucleoside phosphorylase
MQVDERQIREAMAAVRGRVRDAANVGLILGSGLGAVAEGLGEMRSLPYSDVPGLPISGVAGHRGCFVGGTLGGKRLIVQQGRFHLYEGLGFDQILLPLRIMYELGARVLIVTNAAGGVNPDFRAGDLMLITDHINLMGANPLIGPNDERLGPRFPDMSNAYDPELRALALGAARDLGIELKQGVYLAVSGPSYETDAEVRAFRTLGADAVGMSTVPEVIYAKYLGLRVLGLSVIANMAVGTTVQPLSHDEVVRTVAAQEGRTGDLIEGILATLRDDSQ